MKKLFIIFIFFISFQTLSKADDIRDFELEGMSIGDSLLDFYNQNQINKFQKIYYPDQKYIFSNIYLKEKEYSSLQVGYRNGDENYIIELLNGVIRFNQEIEKCYKKQEEIKEYIESNIEYLKKNGPFSREYVPVDAFKKIKNTQYEFNLSGGDIILYCIDHHEENKKQDKLKLQLQTNNMSDYLTSRY